MTRLELPPHPSGELSRQWCNLSTVFLCLPYLRCLDSVPCRTRPNTVHQSLQLSSTPAFCLTVVNQPSQQQCLRRRPLARAARSVSSAARRVSQFGLNYDLILTWCHQTPTLPSVASLPTCSSPTTTVTRSVRKTPASRSVSDSSSTHFKPV